MGGKLRHFLKREGRFFSRIAVPKKLRGIIGTSELRAPLGADRREASRGHHVEVAKLMALITAAEQELALTTGTPAAQPRYPMSGEEMAQMNYRFRVEQDAEARIADAAYAQPNLGTERITLSCFKIFWASLAFLCRRDRLRSPRWVWRRFPKASVSVPPWSKRLSS